SQPSDRLINGSRHDRIVLISPDFTQQLVTVHNSTVAFGQVAEYLEFPVRQTHESSSGHGSVSNEINRQFSDFHTLDGGLRAAQHSLDVHKQLIQIDRFGDVVISPELETSDPIDFLTACRKNNDGHLSTAVQSRTQLETVDVGKRQIEQNEIWRKLARAR